MSIHVHLWPIWFFLGLSLLHAQDERIVKSPDGKTEFHIFVASEGPGDYDRIAYRVLHEGKTVIDTSFIGLDMLEQEPLFGEKAGLVDTKYSSEPGRYNGLTAYYLQDGSIGRRINVETRAFNDGVAFRYHFPNTTPQAEFLLVEEYTEFAFPPGARAADGQAVASLDRKAAFALPFFAEEPGVGWVAVTEIPAPPYPKVHLEIDEKSVLATVVARPKPDARVVLDTTTPLTGPWRVILVAKERSQLLDSANFQELKQ